MLCIYVHVCVCACLRLLPASLHLDFLYICVCVCMQLSLSYNFIPNQNFVTDSIPPPRPLPAPMAAAFEALKVQLGLSQLQPFPVAHIMHSSGLLISSMAGWKVVFSADTRPCKQVRGGGN